MDMQRVKREKVAALKDIEKVEAKEKEEGLKEVHISTTQSC